MDDYTEPHWTRSALLTIDVQRDFTIPGAPALIPGTQEVVPQIQRLVRAYRSALLPIIHVIRLYLADGSNVDLCRRTKIERGGRVVVPGTEGSQIVNELLPSPPILLDEVNLLAGEIQSIGDQEWIMYKPRWGAFYKTRLGEYLRQLEVDTLVFSGCNYPNCPRTSIYEASERDFRVVIVEDAVSGLYDRGLQELRGIGANVVTTDECVRNVASLDLSSE
ncbi:MAG: cysteine hydrolase [Desulfomonilaceae bacterium]